MNDLKHLFLLIVSPGKTWQKMDKVPYATQIFLNQFLYPLMGITAIVSFLGHFFNDASLPRALQLAIVEFVKFFAGFYALVYVMKIFSTYMLEILQPESRIKRFVGYTLALYMLFDISIFVIRLFIELPSIVDFLPLLLAYVIWNSQRYMEIPDQKNILYVVATTILFLVIPLSIQKLLYFLMPGLISIEMKLPQINIKNKRASFDYELLDTFHAGIVLSGTEIKSIRLGKAGLTDSFCYINNGEIWIKNMYIAEYFYGSYNNHSSRRDRKLLLTHKEIQKIERAAKESGFSIIPTRVFINEKGLAKVVIAIAKGKKEYDKRDSIKEREDKRKMDRMFKR